MKKSRLHISEERYRTIIDDQPDVIRRFLPDGTITFANDAYCSFFMRRKEFIIGANLYHYCTKEVEEAIRKSLAVLTPQNPVSTYERWVQLRDGQLRWVQWINRGIYDENGHIIEYQSTGRDITEIKNTQLELSRRNKELAALYEISKTLKESEDLNQTLETTLAKVLEVMELDGGWIYTLDENDEKLGLVRAAQHGDQDHFIEKILLTSIKKEDVIPTSPGVFPPNLVETVTAFHKGYFASDPTLNPCLHSTMLQGRDRPMGVLCVYRMDQEISAQQEDLLAMIAQQIGVAVENNKLARMNSEVEIMREVDRIRSELIANVSHEMKTPLGLITIIVSTLMGDEVDLAPETRLPLLKDISMEADKLNEIVNNLLNISKIEARKGQMHKKECSLQTIVEHVVQSLSPQASAHHLVVDFPERPLVVSVDEKQIEHVFRNLITNAVKYSPAGSNITVTGDHIGDEIIITIKDEGIGISTQDLKHVFERFFRADDSRVKKVAGIGLGLAICREIIEAHNGRIWVESTVNQGSSFSFSLPIKYSPMFEKGSV